MKKRFFALLFACLLVILSACSTQPDQPDGTHIAATTYPIYQFTTAIAENTPLQIDRIITESVSCVHDYSLTVRQMQTLSDCSAAVISGHGLEDFLEDVLPSDSILDASTQLDISCDDEHHDHDEHDGHDHSVDPHYWLDPLAAKQMVQTICDGLCALYPQYSDTFRANSASYCAELETLQAYGEAQLKGLSCRELVTFHDGFGWFAAAFDLHIAAAMEVEAGSEPSAKELEEIVKLVKNERLPAAFVETSGSSSAAGIVAAETGVQIYTLDMGMGELDYFSAMRQNIDTIKEALQ